MSIIKKLFGSEKKYYLELDEAADQASAVVEKVSEVAQEAATQIAKSEPVKEAVKTASKVADQVGDKVSEVVPDQLQSAIATETSDKAKKSSQNSGQAQKKVAPTAKNDKKAVAETDIKVAKKPATPEEQRKNAGASSFDPPFWVAAMYNNSGSTSSSNGTNAEQTFATDNLMPIITKSRRRPGPSLNRFRDMAKSAKTPRG